MGRKEETVDGARGIGAEGKRRGNARRFQFLKKIEGETGIPSYLHEYDIAKLSPIIYNINLMNSRVGPKIDTRLFFYILNL